MKTRMLSLLVFVLLLTACQQEPVVKPVDMEAEKAAISELLIDMTTAFEEQDVSSLISVFSEKLYAVGSAPSEEWDKKQITSLWTDMLAHPFEINFIGEPVIKLAPDGNSAFALQQYYMPAFSEHLAFRNGYHLIKVNGEWKIFISNTACIPENEDLPRINKTLSR